MKRRKLKRNEKDEALQEKTEVYISEEAPEKEKPNKKEG